MRQPDCWPGENGIRNAPLLAHCLLIFCSVFGQFLLTSLLCFGMVLGLNSGRNVGPFLQKLMAEVLSERAENGRFGRLRHVFIQVRKLRRYSTCENNAT